MRKFCFVRPKPPSAIIKAGFSGALPERSSAPGVQAVSVNTVLSWCSSRLPNLLLILSLQIRGSDSCVYEDYCLLGWYGIQHDRHLSTLKRNLMVGAAYSFEITYISFFGTYYLHLQGRMPNFLLPKNKTTVFFTKYDTYKSFGRTSCLYFQG